MTNIIFVFFSQCRISTKAILRFFFYIINFNFASSIGLLLQWVDSV